jgi:septum formation protein
MSYAPIVLASRSPRRSQLLRQIGVPHEVLAVDFDEARLKGESPRDYVQRLAGDKALHALRLTADPDARPLLTADTVVALDDEIFGKPENEADCERILGALSGRTHEVMTAVALHYAGSLRLGLSISRVAFRPIGVDERRAYWRTGEPADKAGSYAIQGLGAVFVERLEGSYSGVMGLPLFETTRLLDAAGVRAWQERGFP